ncbi:hypothetical protein EC844_102116 [Acinetobacter calcoaceticus]|uniref:Uncharacterized protein n=1 Tax=Acinetobacter calcoaceticus TaxID=471 RepID=A0A4R1Y0Z8_ACICA|nr:hypothetical protein EC844_102116 [Acinetobacter calcoaceticus]
MRLLIALVFIYTQLISSMVYASDAHVLQAEPYFDFNTVPEADILDIAYDRQDKDYSVMSNQLYGNERIRIFNYTAYDSSEINTRLKSGNFEPNQLSELSISFGYGIEFLVNPNNKIGYEFLSSFPYDRGQVIRFFWVRAL